MRLKQYQVDAFASRVFEGNPAAVCPLEHWLDDSLMQSIAEENNLAETAFFVPDGENFHIRWFTPKAEVALCGHATLASAFVLLNELDYMGKSITFNSLSGPLTVHREESRFFMDFPNEMPVPCDTPAGLDQALGCDIEACYLGGDLIVELASQALVEAVQPNLAMLAEVDARGVIVTSQSSDYDFVNRCFFPVLGIDEDPVTGSAYTQLAPLWAQRLGRQSLTAKQVSPRGGEVFCHVDGDRVGIAGHARLFMRGEIVV